MDDTFTNSKVEGEKGRGELEMSEIEVEGEGKGLDGKWLTSL